MLRRSTSSPTGKSEPVGESIGRAGPDAATIKREGMLRADTTQRLRSSAYVRHARLRANEREFLATMAGEAFLASYSYPQQRGEFAQDEVTGEMSEGHSPT